MEALGSSIAYAMGAKRVVMQVIRDYDITSIIDAPCGAFVWQAPMVQSITRVYPIGFRYLGVDVASTVIAANRVKYKSLEPTVSFETVNLVEEALPSGYELILSRDALQHNSLSDVRRILQKFANSDAKYLLVGSYPTAVPNWQMGASPMQKVGTNVDITTGEYMRINLEAPPFNLVPKAKFAEKTPDEKWLLLYECKMVAAALSGLVL